MPGSKWRIPKLSVLKWSAKKQKKKFSPDEPGQPDELAKPYWTNIFWSRIEVADYLCVSKSHVWNLIMDGEFEGAFQS